MNANFGLLIGALLLVSGAYGASCTAPRAPQMFYVSTNGNDSNDGSLLRPFRNIQTGVDCLIAGDRLRILSGTYTEFVKVRNRKGKAQAPIVIEGVPGIVPGPLVTIQGSITNLASSGHIFAFHEGSPSAPNNEWIQNGTNGEYVSRYPLPPGTTDWAVNQGGFIDAINGRHTRLIAYSRIEDLRSTNETFEKIIDGPLGCPPKDPREGPIVSVTNQGCTERRPWVYMGPGIWFDNVTHKVHIRLSPTHNSVPGLADYDGEKNPNNLPLAISEKNMYSIKVENSNHVVFNNLAVKFSSVSILVTDSTNIRFNDMVIWAGRFGVRAGRSEAIQFSNTLFDGGMPTWAFRNDLKDQYEFIENGQTKTNFLGKATMETLFASEGTRSIEIHHSEFINGHDLYLAAPDFQFHHNWINNLNDEGIFLDGSAEARGSVHHNVITQTLSAIGFAGIFPAGPWYIYRNLIDLRQPTAGFRPRNANFNRAYVWRPGAPFKSRFAEGPHHIFQNTFIVPFAAEFPDGKPIYPQASFTHLRNSIAPLNSRSSLNNVFVVLSRETNQDAPLAFLLPSGSLFSPAVFHIDGDLFYRKGFGEKMFATPIPGDPDHFHLFFCKPSDNCLKLWHANPFFESTQNTNPPGYEANAILLRDPEFSFWSGEPHEADDFRLKPSSPARGTGVPLPIELQSLDLETSGVSVPDIGAYQTTPGTGLAPKLRVGVRGKKIYPQTGPGN